MELCTELGITTLFCSGIRDGITYKPCGICACVREYWSELGVICRIRDGIWMRMELGLELYAFSENKGQN